MSNNILEEKRRLLEKKKKIASQMRALNEKERKMRARALITFGGFCLEQFKDETFLNLIKIMNEDLRKKGLKDADTIISMLQKEREKIKIATKQPANSNETKSS